MMTSNELKLTNYNYDAASFLKRIAELLKRDQALLGVAVQRSCLSITNNKPEHAITRIDLLSHNQVHASKRRVTDYGSLILTEETLSHEQLIERLELITQKRFVATDFELDAPSVGFYDNYEPSNNQYNEWPCRVFDVGFGGAQLSQEPLLHPSLPSYSSPFDAIKSFLGFSNFNGSSDSRLGHILVCFPNFNARISSLLLLHKDLEVTLETNCPSNFLKLDATYAEGEQRVSIDKMVETINPKFQLSFNPSELSIWLIARSGFLVDYHEENQHYSRGTNPVLPKSGIDSALPSVLGPWQTIDVRRKPLPESKDVFVIHGHDSASKEKLARFLEKLKLNPVILHEKPNKGNTIIEKFEVNSQVVFAVALLTADDEGRKRNANAPLISRARQNVLFEFGFFIGKLGRDRVCALLEKGVEVPSDYQGVMYIPLDSENRWRFELVRELKAAGLDVDANLAV